MFLGYPSDQKRYKLLNLENKRVFKSKDVHFFENIFPFVTKSNDSLPSIFLNYSSFSTDQPDSQTDLTPPTT